MKSKIVRVSEKGITVTSPLTLVHGELKNTPERRVFISKGSLVGDWAKYQNAQEGLTLSEMDTQNIAFGHHDRVICKGL